MSIQWAYDVRDDRPVGQSKWLIPRRTISLRKRGFGLVIHREQRNLPFFALLVDNGGLKIQLSDPEPAPATNTFSMSEPGHLIKGHESYSGCARQCTVEPDGPAGTGFYGDHRHL
jgi:uncharacterized protein (TIGR03435 family)